MSFVSKEKLDIEKELRKKYNHVSVIIDNDINIFEYQNKKKSENKKHFISINNYLKGINFDKYSEIKENVKYYYIIMTIHKDFYIYRTLSEGSCKYKFFNNPEKIFRIDDDDNSYKNTCKIIDDIIEGIYFKPDNEDDKKIQEQFNKYVNNYNINKIVFGSDYNKEIKPEPSGLPEFKLEEDEGKYNERVSNERKYFLADKKQGKTDNIELADLIDIENHTYYHIKRRKRDLRVLAMQVFNSICYLINNGENDYIRNNSLNLDTKKNIFVVGVITETSNGKKSFSTPQKITFNLIKNLIKNLDNIELKFEFIDFIQTK